jgi:molybdate transport system substrate-binding protein
MRRTLFRGGCVAGAAAVLLTLLITALPACGSGDGATTTSGGVTTSEAGGQQELTVSAASSLKNAFTEIGKAFDAVHNSVTTFNFDGSGTLQRQIEAGAPVDVFASAAMKQVTALVDQNLVEAESVQVFAGNEIVLVVPADSKLALASFEDLTKADVKKIAYGDPKAAPHGVAAEEMLTELGILEQVKPKVIYALNVSQALEYVMTGEVDAGILFATEAKAGDDKVKIVAVSDPSWHSAIAYPIGIVTASEAKTLAQAFIDYVMGPDGQSILEKYGFLRPPAQ